MKGLQLSSFPLKLQVSLTGKAHQIFPASSQRLTLPEDSANPSFSRDFFLMAVKQGRHALVARLLIEEKMQRLEEDEKRLSLIDARNLEEQTALLIACVNLDLEMIRLLIHMEPTLNYTT